MGRLIASIVAGSVVALLAGIAAWFFLMAATWSSIHGGMSGVTLAVLSLIAIALPPGSGFLVGRAIYRWRPAPRRAIQVPEPINLNCPDCGCSMKRSAEYPATAMFTVVKCPIHGPYHFGSNTELTLGEPPQC